MNCSYWFTYGPGDHINRRLDFSQDSGTVRARYFCERSPLVTFAIGDAAPVAHPPNEEFIHELDETQMFWQRQTLKEKIEIMQRALELKEPAKCEEPVCFAELSSEIKSELLRNLVPVGSVAVAGSHDMTKSPRFEHIARLYFLKRT